MVVDVGPNVLQAVWVLAGAYVVGRNLRIVLEVVFG
jgi:hypothetical protein